MPCVISVPYTMKPLRLRIARLLAIAGMVLLCVTPRVSATACAPRPGSRQMDPSVVRWHIVAGKPMRGAIFLHRRQCLTEPAALATASEIASQNFHRTRAITGHFARLRNSRVGI